MKKRLFLFAGLVIGYLLVLAQPHVISGRILDELGQPAGFASIRVKSGKASTLADVDGNYSIRAVEGDTLLITGANLTETMVVAGSSSRQEIQVLRKDTRLSEVVVTALGVKKSRSALGYSTQQITSGDLNRTPATNFVNNMSGKVAGLQITSSNAMGGSNNVIVRGMKSLTQSNQALFVVDGVPYDNTNQSRSSYDLGNSVSDINPDDIESITVLKGAAAALYGSRASNGVVLITTKKTSRKKGLGVTAGFAVTVGSPDNSTLPEYQTEYGQGYGSNGLALNPDPNQPGGGFFYNTPALGTGGQPVTIVQTNNDAATGPAYDPSLMVYNWDAFTPGDPNYGKATPWKPAAHFKATDFFVTPVTTSSRVFVDGAGDKTTFKLGYTHDDSKDYFPNSYLKRNLLNLAATYAITEKVTAGGSVNYSDTRAIGRYLFPYSGTTSPMTDFRQWWPTNVDVLQQKADYFNTKSNASWNWPLSAYTGNVKGSLKRPSYHDNLYWDRYENAEEDGRTRYFGNVYLNYKISSSLNLLGRAAIDYYDQLVETKNNVGSQSTSYYSYYTSNYRETNYDLLLNYDRSLGQDWNVKGLLGANIRRQTISSLSASTLGGLVIPGFYALANSKNTPAAPQETLQRKEVDGVFGELTLTYRQLLTLDGTLRRDRSSTLPVNNNSYYYPSVSGSFAFSKLVPALRWLSYGKVWSNYSMVGGDAPVYSLHNTFLSLTPFNGQSLYGTPYTNNNPNLVPEKSRSYEFGLEASFLNNRLGFNVVYYHSTQSDQIMPVDVSNSTGFNQFYVNGGTIQNKGVEASLSLTPVRTRDLSWDITVNWSTNKNKVLSLYNDQPSFIIGTYQNSLQIVAEKGQPYGIIRGTDYVYDAKTGQRMIDEDGYYILNDNPLSNIGHINPDWIGGISNTVRYKNIAFSFLIDVRKGGQVYSLDMDYGSSSGLYPRTAGKNDLGNPVRSPLTNDNRSGGIVLKGINAATGKPNTVRVDESDINNGGYTFSSAYGEAHREFVYDAGYVKLRELAITYSLPAKAVEKLGFVKGLDLSLAGRNLWIIHKNLPYADPEQGQASSTATGTAAGTNGSMGYQNAAYPSIRNFSANLTLKF